jgi:hypothetical protein
MIRNTTYKVGMYEWYSESGVLMENYFMSSKNPGKEGLKTRCVDDK